MTPLEISMLLHYHVSARDFPELSSPAQQEAMDYFIKAGFLKKSSMHTDPPTGYMQYSPTEKLHVYCEALCQVPEPKQVWVINN